MKDDVRGSSLAMRPAVTLVKSIFLLTSFFFDSIHSTIATEDRCKHSMMNGRENRTMATKKGGKKKGGKKKH
jgi:hypothetical protein